MSDTAFSSLPLSQQQLDALTSLGYDSMTAIQAETLPWLLKGRDVVAQAKTGSGKTAAFGISVLNSINPRFFGVQALILSPTRELAEQITTELRKLARLMPNIKVTTLCGGKPIGPQIASLEHGSHIVVGTPGRVNDLHSKNCLKLDQLKVLVLDEADRMLDMGFAEVIHHIIDQTPSSRQTALFSATYPDTIQQMSESIQTSPVSVKVVSEHKQDVIEQLFFDVNKHERDETLIKLIQHYKPNNAVIFCHTKKQCDEVAQWLSSQQIQAAAIHGDLEQRDRDQALIRFANNSCPVLVATDVAARGLDIASLEMVINYELPRDPEVYVHRIGRTGRAGEKGMAMSIVTPADAPRVVAIENYKSEPVNYGKISKLKPDSGFTLQGKMTTIQLDSGRKNKIRPGDILGALTGDAGLNGQQIGKIDIRDMSSYVAVEQSALRQAMNYLAKGKVKGRSVRARQIR
ncbi:ATP-dependent RNA helicase DbpA [Methylophaga sp.]|uniref:ATP-dependent RNA helicase DbpA n=1 Tax=Methylophaga sp. TaxID=2024840 RepID=UPI003A9596F4